MQNLRWHLEGMAKSGRLELGKGMRRYSPYGGGRWHLLWYHTWLWSTTSTIRYSQMMLTQFGHNYRSMEVVNAPTRILSGWV
jgi:hypothetical protein